MKKPIRGMAWIAAGLIDKKHRRKMAGGREVTK